MDGDDQLIVYVWVDFDEVNDVFVYCIVSIFFCFVDGYIVDFGCGLVDIFICFCMCFLVIQVIVVDVLGFMIVLVYKVIQEV